MNRRDFITLLGGAENGSDPFANRSPGLQTIRFRGKWKRSYRLFWMMVDLAAGGKLPTIGFFATIHSLIG